MYMRMDNIQGLGSFLVFGTGVFVSPVQGLMNLLRHQALEKNAPYLFYRQNLKRKNNQKEICQALSHGGKLDDLP